MTPRYQYHDTTRPRYKHHGTTTPRYQHRDAMTPWYLTPRYHDTMVILNHALWKFLCQWERNENNDDDDDKEDSINKWNKKFIIR